MTYQEKTGIYDAVATIVNESAFAVDTLYILLDSLVLQETTECNRYIPLITFLIERLEAAHNIAAPNANKLFRLVTNKKEEK